MLSVKHYLGSCHCGKVQFEINCEEITQAYRCNCSICRRKGALMSANYFSPQQMTVTEGKEFLSRYQFGDHDVYHYFCQSCGIYPFHDGPANPEHYRVNLGCIDELVLEQLAVKYIDGASF